MTVQLLADAPSVKSVQHVSFRLNPALKHPENPVLIPGFPHEWDSLQVNWPSRVCYDRHDRLFKCWYSGLDAVQYDVATHPERHGFEHWLGRLWRTGYAESADGIHWTKPALGQYTHRGQDTNVIVTDYAAAASGPGYDHFCSVSEVWLNPAPEGADDRFLGIFTEIGWDAQGYRSFKTFRKVIYASPDGKRWKRGRVAYDAPSDSDASPAANVVDMSSAVFDPDDPDPRRRYKVYGQTDRPLRPGRGNRGVGVVCAPDLYSLKSDNLQVLLEGEEPYETEIHWSAVKKLDNGYFVMVHDSSRFDYDACEKPPAADLKLAVSRNGLDFTRVHPGTALVARGRKCEYDSNQLVTSSIVEYGDTVYIYYHGTSCIYRPWPLPTPGTPGNLRASVLYPTFMGLATLPRDRFAYAEGPGTLTTFPLTCGEDTLRLNADGDGIRIAALDAAGRETATGRLEHPEDGRLYRKVLWKGRVPSGERTVEIELGAQDRLYSMEWSQRA